MVYKIECFKTRKGKFFENQEEAIKVEKQEIHEEKIDLFVSITTICGGYDMFLTDELEKLIQQSHVIIRDSILNIDKK